MDRKRLLRGAGVAIPAALSLLGIGHGALHAFYGGHPAPWVPAALVVSPVVFALGLGVTLHRFRPVRREPRHVLALSLWSLGGWLFVGALVVLLLLGQQAAGGRVVDPLVAAHLSALGGAWVGMGMGSFHVSDRIERDRAEGLADQVTFFLRLLRHDIRNEATMVQGYAELLESEEGPREELRYVRGGALRILELTNLARAFTRAQGQESALFAVPVVPTVEEAVERCRARYPRARIQLEASVDEELAVKADDLVSSVVENLVNNAVVHNPGPEPAVRVALARDGELVRVRVADNGSGVPASVREDLFRQGAKGPESEGMGLGLYLVRVLAEQYGGEVRLEETGPGGSTFVLELPVLQGA